MEACLLEKPSRRPRSASELRSMRWFSPGGLEETVVGAKAGVLAGAEGGRHAGLSVEAVAPREGGGCDWEPQPDGFVQCWGDDLVISSVDGW
jgi:hypothetical protein